VGLVAILAAGALLRLAGASRAPLELSERDCFAPVAMTISWAHPPICVAQHGAPPAYCIRRGSLILGDSPLRWRIVSVIAGAAPILPLYLIAACWWGALAGLIAAALLGVERYHIIISGKAIDLPIDSLFGALAMFAFSRFLHSLDPGHPESGSGRWLHGTTSVCALGFLRKELTALMLPVILLTFFVLWQTERLWRREPWITLALFVLLILPDLCSNLTVTRAERMEVWNRH